VPLRAPTADEGLAAACRDTFSGTMRLRVWRKGAQGARFGSGVEVLSATSTSAALEVNRMVSLSLSLFHPQPPSTTLAKAYCTRTGVVGYRSVLLGGGGLRGRCVTLLRWVVVRGGAHGRSVRRWLSRCVAF
jgi:hypothetical protein